MADVQHQIPGSAVSAAFARSLWEGLELWSTGCDLWLRYLAALPEAMRSPAALMDANTRFLAESLDISGAANSALMRDMGLRRPTLSDGV